MRCSSLIPLSIALLFACGHASATGAVESQQISADANASCPESTNPANDRGDPDPSVTSVAPMRRAEKAKTLATPRSTGTRAVAPRWHSFLPGMIR